MIGAVVASAAQSSSTTTTTTTTAPPPTTNTTIVNVPAQAPPTNAALPCNPAVSVVNGVTYYQCGNTYYMQAYGSAGPIYMPVPPPG